MGILAPDFKVSVLSVMFTKCFENSLCRVEDVSFYSYFLEAFVQRVVMCSGLCFMRPL